MYLAFDCRLHINVLGLHFSAGNTPQQGKMSTSLVKIINIVLKVASRSVFAELIH